MNIKSKIKNKFLDRLQKNEEKYKALEEERLKHLEEINKIVPKNPNVCFDENTAKLYVGNKDITNKVSGSSNDLGSATAWVVFNGGKALIKDSYNIKQIIRHNKGVYEIVFKDTMDNTNYATLVTNASDKAINNASRLFSKAYYQKKDSVYVSVIGASGSMFDSETISVVFYGGKDK